MHRRESASHQAVALQWDSGSVCPLGVAHSFASSSPPLSALWHYIISTRNCSVCSDPQRSIISTGRSLYMPVSSTAPDVVSFRLRPAAPHPDYDAPPIHIHSLSPFSLSLSFPLPPPSLSLSSPDLHPNQCHISSVEPPRCLSWFALLHYQQTQLLFTDMIWRVYSDTDRVTWEVKWSPELRWGGRWGGFWKLTFNQKFSTKSLFQQVRAKKIFLLF